VGNLDGDESNVLIVSHGLWILSLLDYLMHSEEFHFESEGSVPGDQVMKNLIHNTAVTKIRISRQLERNGKRKFHVFILNDHSHLGSLSSELKIRK